MDTRKLFMTSFDKASDDLTRFIEQLPQLRMAAKYGINDGLAGFEHDELIDLVFVLGKLSITATMALKSNNVQIIMATAATIGSMSGKINQLLAMRVNDCGEEKATQS